MAFKVPEQYRDQFFPSKEKSLHGLFRIPNGGPRHEITVIASTGLGWEHVSVSKKYECPTWAEMCKVKDLFWDEDDTVIQFHPPKSEYVNNHPYCLHLWRPVGESFPMPESILVGVKNLK